MIWTDNPERDFARWDAERAEDEKKRKECDCCGYLIYGKGYYCFGHNVCADCMEDFAFDAEEDD